MFIHYLFLAQNKEFENFNLGEVPEERQDDFIISLNYNDPILVS